MFCLYISTCAAVTIMDIRQVALKSVFIQETKLSLGYPTVLRYCLTVDYLVCRTNSQ